MSIYWLAEFLKEMENQNYMCIERISGSSVGSIAGLIYFMDCLDFFEKQFSSPSKIINVSKYTSKNNLDN